jgi:NAD(P)-dependent dehydrogenase (short-subunit alcohol dehydrogenase family)
VNAVGPGSMAKFQEMEPRDRLDLDDYERQRIPLGRLGVGGEVAAAVMFLASREAAYVTGTTLYVDGGALAAW